jgi:hypothetical protein
VSRSTEVGINHRVTEGTERRPKAEKNRRWVSNPVFSRLLVFPLCSL